MHGGRRFIAATSVVGCALVAVAGPAFGKAPAAGQPCKRSEVGKVVAVSGGRVVCARGVGRVDTWLRLAPPTTAAPLTTAARPVEPTTTAPATTLILRPSNQPILEKMALCKAFIASAPRLFGEVVLSKQFGGDAPIGCQLFIDTTATKPSPPSRAPHWDVTLSRLSGPRTMVRAGDIISGPAQYQLTISGDERLLPGGARAWHEIGRTIVQDNDGTITIVGASEERIAAVVARLWP